MQQPAPIVNEKSSPQLAFSEKYTAEHAEKYFSKHQQGFWRTLSTRRETAIARQALKMAGNPTLVLDLPSGTGRFWVCPAGISRGAAVSAPVLSSTSTVLGVWP